MLGREELGMSITKLEASLIEPDKVQFGIRIDIFVRELILNRKDGLNIEGNNER